MNRKTRINVAMVLSFGYLITTELIGSYLPNWLSWLAFPTFLIGGAFIFAGPIVGLLLEVVGATIFTVVFYFVIGIFIKTPNKTDVP